MVTNYSGNLTFSAEFSLSNVLDTHPWKLSDLNVPSLYAMHVFQEQLQGVAEVI